MALRKLGFNRSPLVCHTQMTDDVACRGAILLYRPAVHAWWILRNWRQRPCASIVLAVWVEALVSLLSINCMSTLITQVVMMDDAGFIHYRGSGGAPRSVTNDEAMPRGYIESCIELVPKEGKGLAIQALRGPMDSYRTTCSGLARHMGLTLWWLLTGLCTRRRAFGDGVRTSTLFSHMALWTSGSLFARVLWRNGYDVGRVCGASGKHFRNCDFMKLVDAGEFQRVR